MGKVREDRRDSYDEIVQLKIIKNIYKEIANEFNLELDLSDFAIISKTKINGRYFSKDGKLVFCREQKRNPYTDSKKIDSIAYFRGKNNMYIDVCTFCKYTKGKGGSQDDIPFEVKVTKDCINNNGDRLIVLFMLEGGYWTNDLIKKAEFDNKKTFHITRETVKETLIKIFKSNNLI